ncbi:hypothetical protein FRC07_008645, partial [Ceratobasidium sp. 392]
SSITNLALHLIARAPDPQSDPAAGAGTGTGVTPEAALGTTAPSGSGSNQALVGALVVLGLIFAGFILYFAWQCVGFLRGGRSGKPMFGYVGV